MKNIKKFLLIKKNETENIAIRINDEHKKDLLNFIKENNINLKPSFESFILLNINIKLKKKKIIVKKNEILQIALNKKIKDILYIVADKNNITASDVLYDFIFSIMGKL